MVVNSVSAEQVQRSTNGARYVVTPASTRQQHQDQSRYPRYQCRAQQPTPRFDLVKDGEAIAIDVEGVLLPNEQSTGKSGVGRVSVVNESGEVIYDVFAYYPKDIEHRPSPQWLKLGVKYKDIMPRNRARPIGEILRNVERICQQAGAMVCHGIENEIHYMASATLLKMDKKTTITIRGFDLTQFRTFDTQMFAEYRKYGLGDQKLPSLKNLVSGVLKRQIQVNDHSSVEDAQATMELFLIHRDGLEGISSPSSESVILDSEEEIEVLTTRTSETSLSNAANGCATMAETPTDIDQNSALETVVAASTTQSVVTLAVQSDVVTTVQSHAVHSHAITTVQSYAAKTTMEKAVAKRSWAQVAHTRDDTAPGNTSSIPVTTTDKKPVKFDMRRTANKRVRRLNLSIRTNPIHTKTLVSVS
jgi:hypothetical protein